MSQNVRPNRRELLVSNSQVNFKEGYNLLSRWKNRLLSDLDKGRANVLSTYRTLCVALGIISNNLSSVYHIKILAITAPSGLAIVNLMIHEIR